MRASAAGKPLAVFPGVELSTLGGHVLGIFDVDEPVSDLEALLKAVGISDDCRGDGTMMASASIEKTFLEIDRREGIAIAAHIERWPSGFLETKESRNAKQRIHGNPHLTALEITQPENRDLWRKGEMRFYTKPYPCIQGSDAHALADVGRRPTYIKMPDIRLGQLRQALKGDNALVRFPEDLV